MYQLKPLDPFPETVKQPPRTGLPSVTIIVLSHRFRSQPDVVDQCLASVRSQQFADLQVIVQYCDRLWPEKLNDAAKVARGEWLIILCDDDALDPLYCAKTVMYAQQAEQALGRPADLVYTDRLILRPDGTRFHFRMHGEQLTAGDTGQAGYWVKPPTGSMAFGSSLPMTMLIRRSLWDRLGGHDPYMPHSDSEFWYRACMAGATCVYVPQPLFWYREHAHQMSREFQTMIWAAKSFNRKHFHRFGVIPRTIQPHPLTNDDRVTCEVCPPFHRVSFAATHFTPLTTTGYMATDFRALSPVQKMMIDLQRKASQQQVDAAILLVFKDMGLDPREGWALNDDLDAVRTIPDAPVVPVTPTTLEQTTAPAGEPELLAPGA